LLDLETRDVEPYLQTEFGEEDGEFSPDGRWVAYQSDESGEEEIYVRPFPSAPGKWRISSGGGIDPVWSRDGSTIYYRSFDKNFYGVPVSTEGSTFRAGSPRVVFEDVYENYRGRSYDIAPDDTFLFMKGEGTTAEERNLPILVFNWFEELERLVPTER